MKISDKQREMLAFIEDFVGENKYPPTLEEIRSGLNFSSKPGGLVKGMFFTPSLPGKIMLVFPADGPRQRRDAALRNRLNIWALQNNPHKPGRTDRSGCSCQV